MLFYSEEEIYILKIPRNILKEKKDEKFQINMLNLQLIEAELTPSDEKIISKKMFIFLS